MKKCLKGSALALLTIALLVAPAMVFANGQSDTSAKPAAKVTSYNFGGSTTVEPIITTAIESFAKIHPEARISYDAPGSGPGIQGVIAGTYSLGASSRDISDDEKSKGVVPVAIALDGLSFIVNGSTINIDNLSKTDVAKIFSGEVTNWKQVGGPDAAIVVVVREEGSGTRTAVSDLILAPEFKAKNTASDKYLKEAITTPSNGDMIVKVGSTPNAIGYCGIGYLEDAIAKGGKAVMVNKVAANVANVLNKTYPASRYLYLLHKGDLVAGTVEKAFVDYILSADGQAIVEKAGYIKLPKK